MEVWSLVTADFSSVVRAMVCPAMSETSSVALATHTASEVMTAVIVMGRLFVQRA